MKLTGILDKNKPYEDQPDGYSRQAQNIVITKDGLIQNEDGIVESPLIDYQNKFGHVAQIDNSTVVIFPRENTDGSSTYATVYSVGEAPVNLKIASNIDPEKFSYSVFRNYLEQRVITYIDEDSILRVLNIDEPIVQNLNDNVDRLTKLTPDLNILNTVAVNRVKGGNLKTGRYFISYGLELEDNNPIKWSTPIGPYVVSNYTGDTYTSHVGNETAISDFALNIIFQPQSTSYRGVNVAIIKDIDGVISADIIHKCYAGEAWVQQDILYTGNESLRSINVDEILINKLHVDKVKAVTQIQDSLIISGLESLDESQFDSLQLVANDVDVNFKVSETPVYQIENSAGYRVDYTVDSLEGVDNNASFMPDEVYAFYMNVKLINGSELAYAIPGRSAESCRINPTFISDDYTINERASVPSNILNYNNVVTNISYLDIPRDAKVYQLFNTCGLLYSGGAYSNYNSGNGYKPGYWENSDELYPNDVRFGDLANQPVRHHRAPSYLQCFTSAAGMNFKINANFSNVIIPDTLKPYIAGIYFSAAKRTTHNCLVSGVSPVIPHEDMFQKNGSGVYEAQFLNGKNIRLYDYNLNTNLLTPTVDYIKTVYRHDFDYGNGEPAHDIWNYRCRRDTNGAPNFAPYIEEDIRFTKVKEKFYMPEGNAATDPPNIYVKDNEIINRESCLFVNFNDFKYISFRDTSLPNNLLKQVAVLYNWNDNVYTNFAKQDTFIITEITPSLTEPVYTSIGGDVFPGLEYKKIKYQPEQGGDILDMYVSWLGHSPIMQQARIRDVSADDDVTDKYNKSCIPINDNHNPVIFGDDINRGYIYKFPYRTYKSQVQATESDRLSIRNILVNSYVDCPQNKGSITNVIGKDDTLFIQTADTTWLYKVRDTLKTDQVNAYLGTTEIFDAKPDELILNNVGAGGNSIVNSHLISKGGILFPDPNNGDIFLINKDIDYISHKGLTQDINQHLSGANIVNCVYDEQYDRILVSIVNTNSKLNTVLSYYPNQNGWCSKHTYRETIPFIYDDTVHLGNINSDFIGNKVYTFDKLATCKNLPSKADATAYIDIIPKIDTGLPAIINSIYFKTICESLLDFNNKYLLDHTIDKLLIYTRSKCTGLIDINVLRDNRSIHGNSLTLKYGAWRFNDVKDKIVHYVKNTAANDNINELVDRPYFINELSGDYDDSTISSSGGGGRVELPYYLQDSIVDSYIVVRFIMNTDNKRKVSITDIALSLNQLN